jgi:hypothetical protein
VSDHTCKTFAPGCYRCDLNKDEIRSYLYSLRVTSRGVVHEEWCSYIGARWSSVGWLVNGVQDGDRACKRCMPEGLPDLSILT